MRSVLNPLSLALLVALPACSTNDWEITQKDDPMTDQAVGFVQSGEGQLKLTFVCVDGRSAAFVLHPYETGDPNGNVAFEYRFDDAEPGEPVLGKLMPGNERSGLVMPGREESFRDEIRQAQTASLRITDPGDGSVINEDVGVRGLDEALASIGCD